MSLNLGLRNPVSTRLRVAKFFADFSADFRKSPHGRARMESRRNGFFEILNQDNKNRQKGLTSADSCLPIDAMRYFPLFFFFASFTCSRAEG